MAARALCDLERGSMIVRAAEQAMLCRDSSVIAAATEELGRLWLPREFESVIDYYGALVVGNFGKGDQRRAAKILQGVVENGPRSYRARGFIALAVIAFREGRYRESKSFYAAAGRLADASFLKDPFTAVTAMVGDAILHSLDGNHRAALATLDTMRPLMPGLLRSYPALYHNFHTSYAYELMGVGELDAARQVIRIPLASPFASCYSEYGETAAEIEWRARRASKSIIAINSKVAEQSTNVVTLPFVPSRLSPGLGFERARVLRFRDCPNAQTELFAMSDQEKKRMIMERLDKINGDRLDRILELTEEPPPDKHHA